MANTDFTVSFDPQLRWGGALQLLLLPLYLLGVVVWSALEDQSGPPPAALWLLKLTGNHFQLLLAQNPALGPSGNLEGGVEPEPPHLFLSRSPLPVIYPVSFQTCPPWVCPAQTLWVPQVLPSWTEGAFRQVSRHPFSIGD